MILPDKNKRISHSLIGMGAQLLPYLESSHTVSSLWEKIKRSKEINTYEKYILTLDFLFLLNLITFEEGLLKRSRR